MLGERLVTAPGPTLEFTGHNPGTHTTCTTELESANLHQCNAVVTQNLTSTASEATFKKYE